jgi:hypothetical protein
MSKLREAAEAVIDRWFTPKWNYTHDATGELIGAVRDALAEDALVRLSETHQQLGEQSETLDAALGATDEGLWYEFIGTLDGTYAGRWTLSVREENWSTAWPDGTAVYVRRGQE